MTRKCRCLLLFVLAIPLAYAQPWEDRPPLLTELREDIDYAELLNVAAFSRDQLLELQDRLKACRELAVVEPDVQAALETLRDRILAGKSRGEAGAELGPRQQLVQQALQTMQTTLQDLAKGLLEKLTEKQQVALFLYNSPGRAVQGTVQGLEQARKAPQEHWDAFRKAASQGLVNACRQAGEETVQEDLITGFFDTARTMSDDQYNTHKETLADELMQKIMPGLCKRAQDKAVRDGTLVWFCIRLIGYGRGEDLVETKIQALTEK